MSEILNKIKTASDSELDDLINSLSSEIKESKELDTLGYNFDIMQKGVENYNRELEQYMAQAEADSQIKYGLPFGVPDYGQAGLSEDQKFDLMQDFKPSKTTSLQLLGLNSNEVDGLANQAYNLMYGAASNMDPNKTKDYVQSVIQTFNPNSTIEMAYANELPSEAIADINRIQELQGSGFNVNVDDDLLLYKKDGGNWSVVNEPPPLNAVPAAILIVALFGFVVFVAPSATFIKLLIAPAVPCLINPSLPVSTQTLVTPELTSLGFVLK